MGYNSYFQVRLDQIQSYNIMSIYNKLIFVYYCYLLKILKGVKLRKSIERMRVKEVLMMSTIKSVVVILFIN